SSGRRHTRWPRDWSSDVCSSDLDPHAERSRRQMIRQLVDGLRDPLGFARGAFTRKEPVEPLKGHNPPLVGTLETATWRSTQDPRSEERRVGKECRALGARAEDRK